MPEQTFQPDLKTFVEETSRHRLIPVCTEIVADLDTPLTLFAKVAGDKKHAFLFESVEGGEKWGRYSFVGYDPLVIFSSSENSVEVLTPASGRGKRRTFEGNPLVVLKKLIGELDAADFDFLPRFCGGAVGFLGYDIIRFIEELPGRHPPHDVPDSSFIVPRLVLAHDSFRQKVTIVCWVQTGSGDAESLYEDAVCSLNQVIQKIRQPVSDKIVDAGSKGSSQAHEFASNMEANAFKEMVERAKEYIRSGDIIQVVLSQRFQARTDLEPLTLYRALRHINPSPYLFYLKLDDIVQIGSSPEILVRKDGESIELRPIAGTRKRGSTAAEDLALERELLADPKERAEHLMLVDLGRNDVGRVAKGGCVEVKDLLVVERYSHVMHIVSGVHGVIAEGKDQFDVLSACFPAGTVSGAPKIRAMEIIDELEPDKRGPYAGAVGYFGFSGNMDFCITIRTFLMRDKHLYIQAGAGIVADSDPEKEYEETVNKSMGLRRAVQLAERGF